MDLDFEEYNDSDYNSSYEQDAYYSYPDYPYYGHISFIISDVLILYISPVLIISCLCGNILSFVALCKLASKAMPTISYLALLTLLDTLVLCNGSGNVWIGHLTGTNLLRKLELQSELSCKVYSFLNSVVYHMDTWCFMAFLIEMTVFTRFPSKAHKICTRERTKHSGLFLLLMITCINGHFFFTYNKVPPNMGVAPEWMCTFSPSMDKAHEVFRDYVWPIVDCLLTSVLPIVVIICCLICWLSSSKFKQSLTSNRLLLNSEIILELRRSCFALSILFLILSTPQACCNIALIILEKKGEDSVAMIYTAVDISNTLKDVFLSFKICVYFVTLGSFRRELKKVVCCICRSNKRKPVKVSDKHLITYS